MSERRFLVTGSSGHLGEALVRTLRRDGVDVVGIDIAAGPATDIVGSIADRGLVAEAMSGMTSVLHTATLHKPHIGSHPRADFVETNIEGTLSLLEAAVTAGVRSFVYTSTTSAFGHALVGAREAAWITEAVASVPKNIYGATKTAAEDITHVVHQDSGLPVIVLRTSRFFPEQDDNDQVRNHYRDGNVKANEYLYRRVDLADVVDAHLLAAERGPERVFQRRRTPPTVLSELSVRLETATLLLERIAMHLQHEAVDHRSLVGALHARYGAQDAIRDAAALSVEALGGIGFITSKDTAYLSSVCQCAPFHPPSRLSLADALARAAIGEPLRLD